MVSVKSTESDRQSLGRKLKVCHAQCAKFTSIIPIMSPTGGYRKRGSKAHNRWPYVKDLSDVFSHSQASPFWNLKVIQVYISNGCDYLDAGRLITSCLNVYEKWLLLSVIIWQALLIYLRHHSPSPVLHCYIILVSVYFRLIWLVQRWMKIRNC